MNILKLFTSSSNSYNNSSRPNLKTISTQKRRRVFGIYAAVLLAFLVGCEGEAPIEPLQPGETILAFGDSLTFGKGVSLDKSYPAVLQALSSHTVINAGISGETTGEGLQRLASELDTHNPALVILFEGGNDVLRNLPTANTKANLDQMINQIKDFGAEVALVAVPERSLFSSSAPWYPELAEAHGVPLQDNIVARLIKQPSMKSDTVHFNESGYRALAEAIHEMLQENNAY